MIINFKIFESMKSYNLGDYVALKFDESVIQWLEDNAPSDLEFDLYIAKIIKLDTTNVNNVCPYTIEFYNGYDFSVKYSEIVRLATEDEIEMYHKIKTLKKYNI